MIKKLKNIETQLVYSKDVERLRRFSLPRESLRNTIARLVQKDLFQCEFCGGNIESEKRFGSWNVCTECKVERAKDLGLKSRRWFDK